MAALNFHTNAAQEALMGPFTHDTPELTRLPQVAEPQVGAVRWPLARSNPTHTERLIQAFLLTLKVGNT